jgi:hypothetical protein
LKIPVQKWGFEWENPSTNGGLSIARFDFNAYSDPVYGELMRTPYHIYSLIGIHRAWSLGCAYGGIPKVVQTGHRAIEFFTIQAGDAWHDTTWIWGRAFSFHFCPGYNDVAFVKHLLQHVANRFCVDLSALDFASACDCIWVWAQACDFLGFSTFGGDKHPCSSFSMKD